MGKPMCIKKAWGANALSNTKPGSITVVSSIRNLQLTMIGSTMSKYHIYAIQLNIAEFSWALLNLADIGSHFCKSNVFDWEAYGSSTDDKHNIPFRKRLIASFDWKVVIAVSFAIAYVFFQARGSTALADDHGLQQREENDFIHSKQILLSVKNVARSCAHNCLRYWT